MKAKLLALFVIIGVTSIFGITIYAAGQPAVVQQGITLAATTPGFYGPSGGITVLPVGETVLTDTLFIDGQFGPVLTGQGGKYASWIRWKGAPNADGTLKPVIVIRNCTCAEVCNFRILFDTPCSDAIVISNIKNVKPGTPITSRCRIHDILMDAGTNGNKWMNDGVRIDSSYFGGPDQNNEYHKIYDCDIANFSHAGVGIYSSQAHRVKVSECQFSQSGSPLGTGVYARFASMTMENCKGGNLGLVFYGSDQYAGGCSIIGNNFEGCKRFCDCRLPSGQWIIENNRCDGMSPFDCGDGDYDHTAVFCHAGGYTSFRNNFLASQTNVPVRLMFQYLNGINFIGNTFNEGSAGKPRVLATSNVPTTISDSQWYGNQTQGQPGKWTPIIHP